MRQPYVRKWVDGKEVDEEINPNVADETEAPRELRGQTVVLFSMIDSPPGESEAIIIDSSAHEMSVLLRQVAGWLDVYPNCTPVALQFNHGDGANGRLSIVLVTEK